MNNSEEKLAEIIHNLWRAEKIKIGWHILKDCEFSHKLGCINCHPCVDKWENLTEDQKKLTLINSKLAHEYFEEKRW